MLWTAERAWNHRPGDFVFPGDFVVVLLLNLCYNKLRSTRWCGEIGRRKGLKIPRWQHRTGSSPVTSTTNKRTDLWFVCNSERKNPPAVIAGGFYFIPGREVRAVLLYPQYLPANFGVLFLTALPSIPCFACTFQPIVQLNLVSSLLHILLIWV